MGGYTNYELEFTDLSDWDDREVAKALTSYDCSVLYLRDLDTYRIILCLYSHYAIEDVVAILHGLFPGEAKYRQYGEEKWTII